MKNLGLMRPLEDKLPKHRFARKQKELIALQQAMLFHWRKK